MVVCGVWGERVGVQVLGESFTHIYTQIRLEQKFYLVYIKNKNKKTFSVKEALQVQPRDGNGAGRGQRTGSSPPPCMDFSCPIPAPPRPTPHDVKNFLPHPRPLRPRETPPYPVKLYFLLTFHTNITIFANKMTCFNNKNILEPNKCYKLLSSVHFFFYFEDRIILKKGTEAQKLTKSDDTSRQQPSKK